MKMQTLLLDASYFPILIIDWKKAINLFFTERAEVVEHFEDIQIRSPNKNFYLPKVMRLFVSASHGKFVKFNRKNVFIRDGYRCQYCGNHFQERELTLDHVFPKSRGGKTNWSNIVAACAPCNNKKADHLISDIQMKPLKWPKEPRWIDFSLHRLPLKQKNIWRNWFHLKNVA